ncbi:MAG: hypothetical protein GX081_02380 [Firmicutes bacterium]|nr:hypothetical protein [Bacillota bacterium]
MKFNRDGNYYFGLALLVIASASIIWAFFFDGFDPEDFLVYFLIYAWGFTLLLKSDTEYRFGRLEKAITTLQQRLDQLTAGPLQEDQDQQEAIVAEEDNANAGNLETVPDENSTNAENKETKNRITTEEEAVAEAETPVETNDQE